MEMRSDADGGGGAEARRRLRDLLVARSVRLGEFTLASGASSPYYVDARRTTMTAEGQYLVGLVCLEAIAGTEWHPSHVGGLTLGADPVAYAIAHRSHLDGSPIDAFTVRKEPKGHGTGQQVEGGVAAGARCVVVDDAMTTGGSTLKAVRAVEELGAEVVGVLALIDREEGAADRITAAGHPLLSIFSGPELLGAARSTRSGD